MQVDVTPADPTTPLLDLRARFEKARETWERVPAHDLPGTAVTLDERTSLVYRPLLLGLAQVELIRRLPEFGSALPGQRETHYLAPATCSCGAGDCPAHAHIADLPAGFPLFGGGLPAHLAGVGADPRLLQLCAEADGGYVEVRTDPWGSAVTVVDRRLAHVRHLLLATEDSCSCGTSAEESCTGIEYVEISSSAGLQPFVPHAEWFTLSYVAGDRRGFEWVGIWPKTIRATLEADATMHFEYFAGELGAPSAQSVYTSAAGCSCGSPHAQCLHQLLHAAALAWTPPLQAPTHAPLPIPSLADARALAGSASAVLHDIRTDALGRARRLLGGTR